ncbi:hypothetical protein L195_g056167, partial [Trifolium pratense]
MRTISNEERLAFLAKARQQKANPAVAVSDPLKQLQVEEAVTKEGRSKKKHDGRIRVEIPGKAASGATKTEGVEPPPSKKQKVEKTTQKAGGADKEDLRKKALEYEVKGTLLNYLLTNRHEQEVLEARQKVKMVDDNLADIEKRYSETKAKLEDDIKKLKEEREGEAERLRKDYEEKLAKV